MDVVTIKRVKKSNIIALWRSLPSWAEQFYVSKASGIGSNRDSGGKIKSAVSAFFNFCTCVVKGRILFSRGFFFFFFFWRKTKTSIDRQLSRNGNQAFSCVEFQFGTRVTRAPGARHALGQSTLTWLDQFYLSSKPADILSWVIQRVAVC